MNASYEVVYNVGLLDDIHNYFPALLYDTGRFNDISSVFHYVRSQMNSRFNLYSYGSSLFRANNPIMRERPVVPMPPTPPPTVTQTPATNPLILRRELDTENLAATALLLSMLGATPLTTPTLGTRVLNAGARAFFPAFNEPVTVRPTREEIEEATEITTGLINQSCAICQDTINITDNCRRIIFCRHTYHRNCIDQWFERNVRCPVCRHDIRDTDEETL